MKEETIIPITMPEKKEKTGCGCFFLFVCVVLSSVLSGGGVYYYMKHEAEAREQAIHDSICEVRRVEAERHSVYAAAYEKFINDSIAEANIQTPDLLTFGVRGKVESIQLYIRSYRNTGYRVLFDEDGRLTHYYDEKGDEATVIRNDRGQIATIQCHTDDFVGTHTTVYTYNINGTLESISYYDFVPSQEHFTEYNDYGAPTRSYVTADSIEKIPRCYIYEQYDEHQNWTCRSMKDSRGADWDAFYQRTINYHPSHLKKPSL